MAGTARELQEQLAASLTPAVITKADLTKLDELAFKDVERRAEGLVQLILHNDRKGTQFVATYVAVAGVICGVVLTRDLQAPALIVSGIAVSSLTVGIVFALLAQWQAAMYPTGRLPDFWIWSRRNEVGAAKVIDDHLTSTLEAIEHNETINTRASNYLRRAYICGAVAVSIIGVAMSVHIAALITCRLSFHLTSLWAPLCRL